ncbi:hypothetical protein AJ80_03066 [Polytolypa hystricis UAMH7299]|uniref:Nucleoside transporter n=1 Tax=Polytolypa hystricis (strain UAMH7299) TaxID=1447883 RepID=A0A2B7YKT9_POLH7|nr:hypothetical protein AJ80_03066 [Polytolypa hystricis UAMH7299]
MVVSRVRQLLAPRVSYERLQDGRDPEERDEDDIHDGVAASTVLAEPPFSWLEYAIFLWMGVSMLWAWNMFLAATPYFQRRFASDPWVLSHFQSSILSVSTVTNLACVLVLAKLQQNASYPRRIVLSLLLNIVIFTLLACSTVLFHGASVGVYFTFLLVMVFGASLATGMNQNGIFAYVTGFGRGEYTQAIMAGQGVAGVLPCIVQILSVLAVPERKEATDANAESEEDMQYQSSKSAFAYFATATGVSGIALFAFLHLVRRQHALRHIRSKSIASEDPNEEITSSASSSSSSSSAQPKKSIPLWTLFRKLRWLALALFVCFTITMIFPVYTAAIRSVRDTDSSSPTDIPRMFQPAIFIPLAFLLWNVGDLLGRIILLVPSLSLTHRPRALFFLSLSRVLFIPLYTMCNVRGRGAVVDSDLFYLFIVQFLFGATNGYIGGSCMVGAGEWVDVEEREASGAFMGLMLVGGLTAGSLASFAVAV